MVDLKKRILDIAYKNKLSHLGSYLSAVDIIDKIYKTVEKYIELEYTENIIDYYTRLHIMPYEESQKQCHKDGKNKKIIEQRKKNLKFIEENGLV